MALFIKELENKCNCKKKCECNKKNEIKLPLSAKDVLYKGNTLKYILKPRDPKDLEFIIERMDELIYNLTKEALYDKIAVNIGDGYNIFKQENEFKQLEFKSLKNGRNVNIIENSNDLTFDVKLQYRGLFNSIEEALQIQDRDKADTVGIVTDDGVVEYWWKDGVLDTDLVKKTVDSVTKEEHNVNVVVGNLKPGDIIERNTNIDKLIDLLVNVTFEPTFVSPTFTATNNAGTREIGETFNITVTTTFNKGSINIDNGYGTLVKQSDRAGSATNYIIGGTTQTSNVRTYSVKALANNSIATSVNYSQGPQPKDSKGNNFSTPLSSGTLTANTTFNAYYKRFFGPTNGSVLPRNLPQSALDNSSTTFTLNTNTVEKMFDLYIPSTRTLSEVLDLDALNANITSNFILVGTKQVADAGGTNVNYKHYRLTNAVPYSENHRFQIKIT